jgi:hypothetical protein
MQLQLCLHHCDVLLYHVLTQQRLMASRLGLLLRGWVPAEGRPCCKQACRQVLAGLGFSHRDPAIPSALGIADWARAPKVGNVCSGSVCAAHLIQLLLPSQAQLV